MNARVEVTPACEENSALLAFADIVFEGGFLDGVRIVGITIWRAVGGGVTVLLPTRQNGNGGYHSLLTAECEQAISDLKKHVAEQYAEIAGSHVLPWTCGSCSASNGPFEHACTECGLKKVPKTA